MSHSWLTHDHLFILILIMTTEESKGLLFPATTSRKYSKHIVGKATLAGTHHRICWADICRGWPEIHFVLWDMLPRILWFDPRGFRGNCIGVWIFMACIGRDCVCNVPWWKHSMETYHNVPEPGRYRPNANSIGPIPARFWYFMACF